MKKKYVSPDIEQIRLTLTKDILGASLPESSQTESGVIEGVGNGDIEGDF